jgi:uncharacterized short protein YbdD (DUF466 family)
MPDLRALLRQLSEAGGVLVGIPDYDRYVEHCRATHPDLPVMSFDDFLRDRMNARYGGGGRIARCC